MQKLNRDIGLDITRILAFVSVPSVHFFLSSGFYDTPVIGERMYIMVFMRTFFMTGVPLFMLLSGYLMSGKQIPLDKKGIISHYKKISRVFITYVLATIGILLFRSSYFQESIGLKDGILNILGYTQYSWYVNMYIGFFLLIPFLNALWHTIKNKEGQILLVAVLVILTAGPGIFNIYDFHTAGALRHPWISGSYSPLVPDYWSSIYPVTYYFIGAYIREQINLKQLCTWKLSLLLCGSVLCCSIFNIWRSYSINFISGVWCDWGSMQNMVNTILVFMIVNSVRYPCSNGKAFRFLSFISSLTFGAYILSWIPDRMIYPKLISAEPVMQLRFRYFPLMVGFTVLISLLLSFGVHMMIKWCGRLSAIWKQKNNDVV